MVNGSELQSIYTCFILRDVKGYNVYQICSIHMLYIIRPLKLNTSLLYNYVLYHIESKNNSIYICHEIENGLN